MHRWGIFLLVSLAILISACEPQAVIPDGPQVVRDVTLAPTELLPLRVNSPTASPTPTLNSTEGVSPLLNVTVAPQFVVITPTLPPSKTPTPTPTFTPPPTQTASPTVTTTPSVTVFVLPTSEIIPLSPQPAAVSSNQVCDTNWLFIQPRPASCPMGPPNASTGTYQQFPNGHMIEVSNQSAIYVLYNDESQPRWQVFRDYFQEGMPETSPDYPAEQPIRGFGLLWRDNAALRNRIGFLPIQRYEAPYNVQLQVASDGTVFIVGNLRSSDPRYTGVSASFTFALFPNGVNWQPYSGANIPAPTGGTQIPSLGY